MSKIVISRFLTTFLAIIWLAGCVTAKPVETQSTVDDRPLLFFVSDRPGAAEGLDIYIDDLYMGKASEFINIKKGLAVVSGTHIVEVRRNGNVVMSEKVYLGSGTNKTLPIDAR